MDPAPVRPAAPAASLAPSSAATIVPGAPTRPVAPHAGAGPSVVPQSERARPSNVDRADASNALPAPQEGGLLFAVIGDYGTDSPAEATVAALVKSWDPVFVVTLGDNNYPIGAAATIDVNIGKHYGAFIGNYKGAFGKGSRQNRFWPSLGNHDWGTPGAAPYLAYFTLPGNGRYYDVDLGLVHLYALDSDPREPDGISATSTQGAWLKQRLATSRACYDIVFFHHPAYSTGPHGSALEMRWPYRAWGADVVMAGHDHTYERFHVDGIPYIVNGLGGASRYEFTGAPITPPSERRYNEAYGAMRVVATAASITYEFFSVDGERRDRFVWQHGDNATTSPPCGNRADAGR